MHFPVNLPKRLDVLSKEGRVVLSMVIMPGQSVVLSEAGEVKKL